jgi:hypothetical protein
MSILRSVQVRLSTEQELMKAQKCSYLGRSVWKIWRPCTNNVEVQIEASYNSNEIRVITL